MKKRILTIALAMLCALGVSGCKKKNSDKFLVKLPMENILSMACDGLGNVYLLSDKGLRLYAMSGDEYVDYIYDSEDFSDALFKWNDNGEKVTYKCLVPEQLFAVGEDGVTIMGRYTANENGRESDLFVLQDVVDFGEGQSAYLAEIKRDYKTKTPVVNGIGVTSDGVYFKLNRDFVEKERFDNGVKYMLYGQISACDVPDNVIGAVGTEDNLYFVTENVDGVQVLHDGKAVKDFDGDDHAAVFVSGGAVYAVSKDGVIKKWTTDGKEEKFADLGVALDDINDPFIWDGKLYWYDSEGLKTTK